MAQGVTGLPLEAIEQLAEEAGVDVSSELRAIRGRLAAMEAKVRDSNHRSVGFDVGRAARRQVTPGAAQGPLRPTSLSVRGDLGR